MQVISQQFQIKDRVRTMSEKGYEMQMHSTNPVARKAIDKAGSLLELVVRKKSVHDKKKFERIRRSFEQNYQN